MVSIAAFSGRPRLRGTVRFAPTAILVFVLVVTTMVGSRAPDDRDAGAGGYRGVHGMVIT
jgi:hypothetical protein